MEQLYVRKSRSSSFEKEPGSPGLERRSKKFTQLHSPIEKERTRGRYACLGHRLKHKRCPLDCPERKPKTNPDTENPPQKEVSSSPKQIGATKHILKLDDAFTIISSPKLNEMVPQTNSPNLSIKEERNSPVPQWEQLSSSFDDSNRWEHLGHFNMKSEPVWDPVDSFKWKEIQKSKSDTFLIPPSQNLFNPQDEIDSWFLDDSPVTSSETMYSSDEFDSRRNSIGSSIDQFKENLSRIVISKDMMERSLLEPYFESLICGCYVRIPIGYQHIIRRVERVFENYFHVYPINRTQTTKGIEIIINNCRQMIRLDQISNDPITETELHNWMDELEKGLLQVDLEEINHKAEQIKIMAEKHPHFYPLALEADVLLQVDWNY